MSFKQFNCHSCGQTVKATGVRDIKGVWTQTYSPETILVQSWKPEGFWLCSWKCVEKLTDKKVE